MFGHVHGHVYGQLDKERLKKQLAAVTAAECTSDITLEDTEHRTLAANPAHASLVAVNDCAACDGKHRAHTCASRSSKANVVFDGAVPGSGGWWLVLTQVLSK